MTKATILAASVLALLVAAPAGATPTLMLSSDGNGDGDTLDPGESFVVADSDGNGDVVFSSTLFGTVGNFTVSMAAGITKDLIGSARHPQMDLGALTVSGGAGALEIKFSETGFRFQGQGHPRVLTAVDINGVGNSILFDVFVDTGNRLFATDVSDPQVQQAADVSSSGLLDRQDIRRVYLDDATYSITQVATIIHTASGQLTSLDGFTRVPAPAALSLLGVGLLLLGAGAGRRITRRQAPA